MASITRIFLLTLSALVMAVSADTLPFSVVQLPSNFSYTPPADAATQGPVLSYVDGNNNETTVPTLSLEGQVAKAFPVSLLLPIALTSSGTVAPFTVNSSTIALVSCDPADYPSSGTVTPATVFSMVAAGNPVAILLYTQSAPGCNLTGTPVTGISYHNVWTLVSAGGAAELKSDQNTTSSKGPLIGTIGPPMAINYAAFSSLTNSTNSSITSDYGPSLNTQIAMIVLYTVTGLVSALFLLVIALGAIRAHRHPERYGPRAARRGRAPQTRAGGLARAMLDSLPIQKFGSPDTPKEPDVELATAEGAPNTADSHHSPTLTKDSPATTFESSPDQSPELDRASIRSGIGPATVVTEQARPQATEAPSCSICTDDFEAGQDMRVLPCNHKFHPACVDPWLMNVSGTCPMCRIDLNPNPEPGAERTSTESHGSAHSDRGGRWNPDLAEAPNRGRGTTLPRNRAARVNPFNPNAAPIPSLGESAAAWTARVRARIMSPLVAADTYISPR